MTVGTTSLTTPLTYLKYLNGRNISIRGCVHRSIGLSIGRSVSSSLVLSNMKKSRKWIKSWTKVWKMSEDASLGWDSHFKTKQARKMRFAVLERKLFAVSNATNRNFLTYFVWIWDYLQKIYHLPALLYLWARYYHYNMTESHDVTSRWSPSRLCQ